MLSDETTCDPGSIIAMAGELGYEACGVDLWEMDVAARPFVDINRPYTCSSNLDDPLFDTDSKQRREQFSDSQAMSNSTAMEEFWYATNGWWNDRCVSVLWRKVPPVGNSCRSATCPHIRSRTYSDRTEKRLRPLLKAPHNHVYALPVSTTQC